MRAIETRYDGCRFRSREEARWAVFFNAAGVRYEYEKQGFDLGRWGAYLPDFWLPEQECWIEIKGATPTEAEEWKMHALARQTGYQAYLFFGGIPSDDDLLNGRYEAAFSYWPDEGWDCQHWWCQCRICGRLEIEFQGASDRVSCDCRYPSKFGTRNDLSPLLCRAYEAARSARFEHGESG